jgi:phosphatidylserine/phosphatidylglycerophosphate/cardiolipin synthase-like enzyme
VAVSRGRAGFEAAAASAAAALGATRSRELAGLLDRRRGLEHALHLFGAPDVAAAVTGLYARLAATGQDYAVAAAYLRGYAAAWSKAESEVDVYTVWTGPTTDRVPARSTAASLTALVRRARTELIAMTYSARSYQPLTTALADAIQRGVHVDVVVETLQGAGTLLSGPEPARAFAKVPGIRLWTWDHDRRGQPPGRLHAKLAVADRTELWLGSANLTESGLQKNLEAGITVRGGSAPRRAAEHIRDLQHRGDLKPLTQQD